MSSRGPKPRAVVVAVNEENGQIVGSEPRHEVDREKTCPLLLRVFPKRGGHHKVIEFSRRGEEPKSEVQIYTWMDATLREITELLQDVHPLARHPNAVLDFASIFPDRRGLNIRALGKVHSKMKGPDDDLTLHALKFQIGDFLDVAILTPDMGVPGVNMPGPPGVGGPPPMGLPGMSWGGRGGAVMDAGGMRGPSPRYRDGGAPSNFLRRR